MRLLTARTRSEVEYAARDARIVPSAWQYISQDRNSLDKLRSMRRADKIEYVGEKPNREFIDLAMAMDISVVRFDNGQNTQGGTFSPDGIEFESYRTNYGYAEELRARLGDMTIVVEVQLQREAKDRGIDWLREYLFVQFTGMQRQAQKPPSVAATAAMMQGMASGTAFLGMDFAVMDEMVNVPPEAWKELAGIKDEEDMQTNLVLAADEKEAREFAAVMGFNNWTFLKDYKQLMNYGGSICYVVGGGRDRDDFDAIEGLFIQKKIKLVDMET